MCFYMLSICMSLCLPCSQDTELIELPVGLSGGVGGEGVEGGGWVGLYEYVVSKQPPGVGKGHEGYQHTNRCLQSNLRLEIKHI